MISVQSTERGGRFGEADSRLLSTIAANVGIAIQNARLYQETRRRASEMAALAGLGTRGRRPPRARPDPRPDRASARASCWRPTRARSSSRSADGERFVPVVALGEIAVPLLQDAITPGRGNRRRPRGPRRRRGRQRGVEGPARACTSPGTGEDEEERLMAAPLLARGRVIGMMAVWRTAPAPLVHRRRPQLPRRPVAAGGDRDRERPAVRAR